MAPEGGISRCNSALNLCVCDHDAESRTRLVYEVFENQSIQGCLCHREVRFIDWLVQCSM